MAHHLLRKHTSKYYQSTRNMQVCFCDYIATIAKISLKSTNQRKKKKPNKTNTQTTTEENQKPNTQEESTEKHSITMH